MEALGRRASEDRDYIFPHFIFGNLPPLLLGLIVAAIFAAAMSSSDSALNSLTAASVVDFYQRWVRPSATEEQSLATSRYITLFWGTAATIAALALGGAGSVIELINKVGVVLLRLAARRLRAGGRGEARRPRSGFLGLLGGMAAVIVVHNTLRIQFLWYNVIGCLGVLLTAAVILALGLEKRRRRMTAEHEDPLASSIAHEFRRRMQGEYVPRIARCVSILGDEDVWAKPGPHCNSVGNLLLPLEGNVRQWILCGVGGQDDRRNRDSEFAAENGDPAELVERLQATVDEAVEVVEGLSAADMLEQRTFQQRYDETVLGAVLHVMEHFSGHAGQIYLITSR